VVLVVGDGVVAVREVANASGALKLAGTATARAELEPKFARGAEALNALVVGIRDENAA
jgi:hypothetical protein